MDMGATLGPNGLLYRALLLSLAIHLVIALFIPALASFAGNGPSIETISFVRVLHISVLKARPVAHEHPATAPVKAPVPRIEPRQRATSRPARHVSAQPAPLSAAPENAPEARKGSGVAQAVEASAPATSTATPQAAMVASNESHEDTGGYMPLGAEEPTPVLDPAIRKSLAALGIHTTLTVDVDANGKTKNITFSPPLDVNVENQIRTLLASAHWDPAICGAGVACEAQATIKL
jgi:hypothetical protein